ncbi:caspase domain-containing protein [Mycena sanguinolenta]|nr:caspase domain-containing protein [Mycena sanguinolenta]
MASREPDQYSSRPRRRAKKAALLIGINGLSAPNTGYSLLHGPHQDVAEMKGLLMKSYEYEEENIQVLVDDSLPGNAQPDRLNIMLSIDNLVNGAEPGDKLFFLYSGHTVQVPRTGADEDGMDGCLIPLDGEDYMIKENVELNSFQHTGELKPYLLNQELRARLVDRLSVGVSLVAVFDSCHSASLLAIQISNTCVVIGFSSRGYRKGKEKLKKFKAARVSSNATLGHPGANPVAVPDVTHRLSMDGDIPDSYTFAPLFGQHFVQPSTLAAPEPPRSIKSLYIIPS